MNDNIVHRTADKATTEDPLDRTITITRFANKETKQGERIRGTWRKVFEIFTNSVKSSAADKLSLPGWCPTEFEKNQRKKAKVERVHALVLDIDNDVPRSKPKTRVPDDQVVTPERLAAALPGVCLFTYASFSHALEWPRFRAIVPLAQAVSGDEYEHLWTSVQQGLASQGISLDRAARDPSRLWFMPIKTEHYSTTFREGPFLDASKWLQEHPLSTIARSAPTKSASGSDSSRRVPDRLERARAYARKCDGAVSGGGGHGTTFSVACNVVRGFDLSEDEGFAVLADEYNPRCDPPWSEQDLRHKVKEALKAGQKPEIGEFLRRDNYASGGSDGDGEDDQPSSPGAELADELPVIRIRPEEKEVNDEAVAALRERSEGFYQRGGELVRLHEATVTPVPKATLREELSVVAAWYAYDGRQKNWRRTHPPGFAVDAIHVRQRWGFPELRGVVSSPCLLADGELLTLPGYHPASQLYLTTRIDLQVPDTPTKSDATQALAVLRDLLVDFPFQSEMDEAAALAEMLTPGVRPSLAVNMPFFLNRASTPGTGKDLLAQNIARIWTGSEAAVTGPQKDQNELAKKLFSIMHHQSPPISIWDDLTSWGGPAWQAVLTTPIYTDRVLGESRMVAVPITTVWIGTGNNTRVWGDGADRRVVLCDLLSPYEDPENRPENSYVHPERAEKLDQYVMDHRTELLSACLTILRAYQVAGCPDAPTWGSFGTWARFVAGPLVWLGLPNPCESYQALKEEAGTDLADLGSVFTAWRALFGDEAKTTREILHAVEHVTDISLDDNEVVFRVALEEWFGKMPDHLQLGQRLGKCKGRNVGGYRIVAEKNRAKTSVWRLEQVESPAGVAGVGRCSNSEQHPRGKPNDSNILNGPAGVAGVGSPISKQDMQINASSDEKGDHKKESFISIGGSGDPTPATPALVKTDVVSESSSAGVPDSATPAQRLQTPAAKQREFTSLLNDLRRSRGWLDFPELLTPEHLSRLAIVPGLYPAEIKSITYETAHRRGRTDISWVDMVYTSPVTGHPERVRCWVPQEFVATIEQCASKTRLCRLAIGAAGTMTPWPYDHGTFVEEPYYGEEVA